MENNNVFSRHSLTFRASDLPEELNSERTQNDELRTMIHSLQMPRRILLIEEDPYYIDVVGQAFTEGIVTVTPTWTSGLGLLSRSLYDLVVIEVGSGLQLDMIDLMLYQRWTGAEINFFTPFIAMITEGFNSRASEALSSGCISAIQKPFTATMLRALVVEHLNTKPSLDQGRTS